MAIHNLVGRCSEERRCGGLNRLIWVVVPIAAILSIMASSHMVWNVRCSAKHARPENDGTFVRKDGHSASESAGASVVPSPEVPHFEVRAEEEDCEQATPHTEGATEAALQSTRTAELPPRSYFHPATKRQMLDYQQGQPGEREARLVESHLRALDRDMNERHTQQPTVILLWSNSPVWFANAPIGVDNTCNIPCEWTHSQFRKDLSGVVSMLDDGLPPTNLPLRYHTLPKVGISWENYLHTKIEQRGMSLTTDTLPFAQIALIRDASRYPYDYIVSHELDAHIPVLYSEMSDFIDAFVPATFDQLLSKEETKLASVFFAISKCDVSIVPDRLWLIKTLGVYYPTQSFGNCMHNVSNFYTEGNERGGRGGDLAVKRMGRYLFAYRPENSYGLDYVTEKVFIALRSGSVPIYLGAPNIVAFLPHRDAVIHVSDFESVEALGLYLKKITENRTLLVERHHIWRTRDLPAHMTKLGKLVDRNSDYTFTCKVCNCVRGKIGCPLLPKKSLIGAEQ